MNRAERNLWLINAYHVFLLIMVCTLIYPDPVTEIFQLDPGDLVGPRVLCLVIVGIVSMFWLNHCKRQDRITLNEIVAGVSWTRPTLVLYEDAMSLVWWRNIIMPNAPHVFYQKVFDYEPGSEANYKTVVLDVKSERLLEMLELTGLYDHQNLILI